LSHHSSPVDGATPVVPKRIEEMTLVVAGVTSGTGWIVSDTLITGGTIQLRDREYQVKCLPSQDRQALVSFSGDAHNGAKLIERAAGTQSGRGVIHMLCEAQAEHPKIDFLYMFLDECGPRLFRIYEGCAHEVSATYMGEKDAFEEFQRIRHATEIDPVPKSFEHFMFATSRVPGAPSQVPDAVSRATVSMLRLFMRRAERDVGGWAVPYVLVRDGAYMCQYVHAVSDPILDKFMPGAVVPHGTAEAGGYGLSVTEFGQLEGMVVYRRQTPGGLVLIREATGYRTVFIEGAPAEFRNKASDFLGKPVDIWFGHAPLGVPESLTILRDERGQPAVAIGRRGDTVSLAVLNVATAFRARANFGEEEGPKPVTAQNLTLTLANDRSHVILKLLNDGAIVGESTLNANELDAVIAGLGQFRAALPGQVSPEPDQSGGSQEFVVIDPAWRTVQSPHADIDGIIMRLRHIGLGWVSFLLPRHEGRALGKWLTENCADPKAP
jgi:hypothetical protein